MTEKKDDHLVLLTARNGARAAKKYTKAADGTISAEVYGNAKTFVVSKSDPFSDIDGLYKALQDQQGRIFTFAIRGEPVAGIDMHKAYRRSSDRGDEKATFAAHDRRWVMIDMDGLEIARPVDAISDPEEAVEAALELLPGCVRNADCVWQFGSSMGVKPGISLHLFVMASKPISDASLKAWAKAVNDEAGKKLIDPAPFTAVQPHFIVGPEFVGMENPMPRRMGIRRGIVNVVDFPDVEALPIYSPTRQPPALQKSSNQPAPLSKPADTSDRRNDDPNKPLYFIPQGDPIYKPHAAKVQHYLDTIGGRPGFKDPILSTIATAYTVMKSYDLDLERLLLEIKRRVRLADPGTRSPDEIERYASTYITSIVESYDMKHPEIAEARKSMKFSPITAEELAASAPHLHAVERIDSFDDIMTDIPAVSAADTDMSATITLDLTADMPEFLQVQPEDCHVPALTASTDLADPDQDPALDHYADDAALAMTSEIPAEFAEVFGIVLPEDRVEAWKVILNRFRWCPPDNGILDIVSGISTPVKFAASATAFAPGSTLHSFLSVDAREKASKARAEADVDYTPKKGRPAKEKTFDPITDVLVPALVRAGHYHVYGTVNRYGDDARTVYMRTVSGAPLLYVNTYRPGPYMLPETHLAERPDAWMTILEAIIPDAEYRDRLLDFMAFCVQFPGRRLQAIPVLIGAQGIGKNKIFGPLQKILGTDNIAPIDASDFTEKFNNFAVAGLLFLDELRMDQGGNAYRRIKAWLGDSDAELSFARVERKLQDAVNEEVRGNMIATTNDLDSLGGIDRQDRRLKVYVSPAQGELRRRAANGGDDPLSDLFAKIGTKDEVRRVAHYLFSRDVSGFTGAGMWGAGTSGEEAAIASLDEAGRLVAAMVEGGDLEGVSIFTLRDVLTLAAARAEETRLRVSVTSRSVQRALTVLGFSALDRGQIRVGETERIRPWCREADLEEMNGLPAADIAALYQDGASILASRKS